MRGILLLLVLVSLVAFTGCSSSPRLVPVTGKVTVGGKPAEGAVVMFHPEDATQTTSSATATADGTLSPSTNAVPGLIVGKYKVTVTYPDPTKKPTPAQLMMGTADAGPDLLKGKYGSKATTTLSIEVTPTSKTFGPFEL